MIIAVFVAFVRGDGDFSAEGLVGFVFLRKKTLALLVGMSGPFAVISGLFAKEGGSCSPVGSVAVFRKSKDEEEDAGISAGWSPSSEVTTSSVLLDELAKMG